ncbi:hypothetical protein BD770DRAFT_395121 [Pilaira anomala]|nr:hypothetical protein BD770DRAFT_395121 [Pilaira anomala]
MGDSYQPSNQRESYEYFMIQQPTSSPTSTSTSSSSMTTAMQNNSPGINWPPHHFQFEPTVNQYEYEQNQLHGHQLWSLPYPQQHQVIPQANYQQQWHNQLRYQQQHTVFRSHPDMHHSIYQTYEQMNGEVFQVPTLPVDMYYAPQQQRNVVHSMDPQVNADVPINHNLSQNRVSTSLMVDPATAVSLNQIQVETRSSPLPSVKRLRHESVSPNPTPSSSPGLSFTPRKRKKTIKRATTCTSLEQLAHSSTEVVNERGAKKRIKQEEGVDGETKEVGGGLKGSRKTVDQLERELDFLGDECATILMMLDSLRNAFLADISASSSSSSQLRPNSKAPPFIGTFDSKQETHIDQGTYTKNSTNQASVSTANTIRRRSKIIAQNPEMEREIRTAYDDLMIQVRHLERKVDALEGKSKSAFSLDRKQKQKAVVRPQSDKEEEEEEICSQSSDALSSILSEEDDDDDEE